MDSNIYYDVVGFQCLDHIDHQTNDLFLTRCGIHSCPPGFSWGPKKRPQYHMHIILNGSGCLEIDHMTFHLHAGQIFLIPPNTVSHYCASRDDPWTYAFLSFQGNKVAQYLRQAGFPSSVYVRDCNLPPQKYEEIIREMLQTHQLTITNELRRVSLLFAFFSLLTQSAHTSDDKEAQYHDYLPETYFEHALHYIQLNYNKTIHIQDIADYIGITRSYLFHLFNQKLNLSPQKYLMNYRMNMAKKMLASTDHFVKDIALDVGYEDSLAFSKVFRSATGYSPSAYRKYIAGLSEN